MEINSKRTHIMCLLYVWFNEGCRKKSNFPRLRMSTLVPSVITFLVHKNDVANV